MENKEILEKQRSAMNFVSEINSVYDKKNNSELESYLKLMEEYIRTGNTSIFFNPKELARKKEDLIEKTKLDNEYKKLSFFSLEVLKERYKELFNELLAIGKLLQKINLESDVSEIKDLNLKYNKTKQEVEKYREIIYQKEYEKKQTQE